MPGKLFTRNFTLLLQGAFVSRLGDVVYSIAIGYFVYHETGSASLMALFTSIALFLNMFLSPIAGAIGDRIDRRGTIVLVDALRGVLMLLIGALILLGRLGTGPLFGITVAVALLGVMFNPTAASVLMDIVPRSELVRARSVTSASQTVVDLVGKAFSGLLLVYVGVGELVVFNGISFLVNAVLVLFVRIPRSPKQGTGLSVPAILADLRDGLRALVATRGLNVLFFSAIGINFLGAGFYNLLLVFTTEKGFSLAQYGYFMTALSVGGLAGSLLVSAVRLPAKARPAVLVGSFTLSGAAVIAGLLLRPFLAVSGLFLVGDLLSAVGNTILTTALMLLIPHDKRATVMGFLTTSMVGGMALSTVAYGFLADRFPVSIIGAIGTGLALVPLYLMLVNRDVKAVMVESASDGEGGDAAAGAAPEDPTPVPEAPGP